MNPPFDPSYSGRPVARLVPNPKLRFLDQCREVLRFKQMSPRTEKAYVDWIRRFIVWAKDHSHLTPSPRSVSGPSSPRPEKLLSFAEISSAAQGEGGEVTDAVGRVPIGVWRHPKEMGAAEVRGFLTHLAAERNVAASTQNQAVNALVFLYREVIGGELDWIGGFEPAKRGTRLPEVLSRPEVQAVLQQMTGTQALIGRLLCGTGMRLLEGLRLRVKDVDFARHQIVVRGGKVDKDRVTMLPELLREPLKVHLHGVRELHERDLAAGYGEVWLPKALSVKFPRAAREWSWQWVFPSSEMSVDRESGARRRHHVTDAAVQRAVKLAVGRA